jgi:hypothetical protein
MALRRGQIHKHWCRYRRVLRRCLAVRICLMSLNVGPELAPCRVVNPFSLEKMTYLPETGEVAYRSTKSLMMSGCT